MHSGSRDPFTTRIRQHLETSLESLDEPTLERLATARATALAAARRGTAHEHSQPFFMFQAGASGWLLPAGAMASIAVMVLTLGLLVNSASSGGANDVLDVELLSSGANLDVYDNLDFYRWLAANDRAG